MSDRVFQIKLENDDALWCTTLAGDLNTLRDMIEKERYLFVRLAKNDPFNPDEARYVSTNHILWIREV